ncbi:hypothetical protein GWI33_005384 [Rhynchophorus ferrugineus]|uniref:Uncharacterized protein n=1 Tax=Rhynchophorus ferrugineus TaxID=354439 RepID=A0A834MEL5_RHYFE|nr:hypothetical protein GWI33_005384 [Rhynchophorus ferrugineus]
MMRRNGCLCSFLLVFSGWFGANDGLTTEYKNKWFHYPYGGPFMGILSAFAIPLRVNTPGDVFMAVNFEASFSLPENDTTLYWPPIVGSTARQLLYEIVERKFESHGHPGHACLLRAICEGAEFSSQNTGVLGDLVHVILTPSSSLNTNLTREYQVAEQQATKKGKCKKYKKSCSFSIMNMFGWIGTTFDAIANMAKRPVGLKNH